MTGQPSATTAVSLTNASYSTVATAPYQVRLICSNGAGARIHFGTSAPSISTENYYPIGPYIQFEMSGLAGCNVYACSEGPTATLRVVAA